LRCLSKTPPLEAACDHNASRLLHRRPTENESLKITYNAIVLGLFSNAEKVPRSQSSSEDVTALVIYIWTGKRGLISHKAAMGIFKIYAIKNSGFWAYLLTYLGLFDAYLLVCTFDIFGRAGIENSFSLHTKVRADSKSGCRFVGKTWAVA
jgi:hypothetical protein